MTRRIERPFDFELVKRSHIFSHRGGGSTLYPWERLFPNQPKERVAAWLLVGLGYKKAEVARWLGVTRYTVWRWVTLLDDISRR